MSYLNIYKYWFLMIFLSGLLMFYLGMIFLLNDKVLFVDWEVLSLNSSSIVMTFLFDWMSLIFMGCVLLISSMVIFYSSSYMGLDMFKVRFLYLVLMFVLSMMLLIISPNLISILLGWDGLGLVSYCLVIYFQNVKSYNSGMLTVLSNRIGDVAILISIAWMFNFGGWNYIYYVCYYDTWMDWVICMLVLAAFTKSAQIPFSSWLPAAMAAPTPVSALVHSSTLVTAGVYLLIRFSELVLSVNTFYFLLLSTLTMFMSGLGANFEYDLKKIIALSTLSQLGLMMSILFMGYPLLAYFHLLSHAFFKALLFLCAGLIIHNMSDSQDIRDMGFLVNQLPYTSICFSISSFSLCGMPFLAGFYSKDMILEYLSFDYSNAFIYVLFFVSVGLTVSYSMRLVYYSMTQLSGLYVCQNYEEDKDMMYSMVFLTFMAILSGSLLSWLLFPNPCLLVFPLECKLMPLLFVIFGGLLGYISFNLFFNHMLNMVNMLLVTFMGSMWFMPYFSTNMMSTWSLLLSKYYSNFMDMGWGEFMMSKSHITYMNNLVKYNIIYQNNNIKLYLLSFLFFWLLMFYMN